jgi:hypothetical protein
VPIVVDDEAEAESSDDEAEDEAEAESSDAEAEAESSDAEAEDESSDDEAEDEAEDEVSNADIVRLLQQQAINFTQQTRDLKETVNVMRNEIANIKEENSDLTTKNRNLKADIRNLKVTILNQSDEIAKLTEKQSVKATPNKTAIYVAWDAWQTIMYPHLSADEKSALYREYQKYRIPIQPKKMEGHTWTFRGKAELSVYKDWLRSKRKFNTERYTRCRKEVPLDAINKQGRK